MQYIDQESPKEIQLIQTRYDKTGKETTEINGYCAEVIQSSDGKSFFVKTYSSMLHDPYGPYSKRESVLDLKLKKVSEKTFNNYIQYLKTKNLKYFSMAQRGFIDDRP